MFHLGEDNYLTYSKMVFCLKMEEAIESTS